MSIVKRVLKYNHGVGVVDVGNVSLTPSAPFTRKPNLFVDSKRLHGHCVMSIMVKSAGNEATGTKELGIIAQKFHVTN